jgi:hypothetical protein
MAMQAAHCVALSGTVLKARPPSSTMATFGGEEVVAS